VIKAFVERRLTVAGYLAVACAKWAWLATGFIVAAVTW
jgi:hypothetical protein